MSQELLDAFENDDKVSSANNSCNETQDVLEAFEDLTQSPVTTPIEPVFKKPMSTPLKSAVKYKKQLTDKNVKSSNSYINDNLFNIATQQYSSNATNDDQLDDSLTFAPTQVFNTESADKLDTNVSHDSSSDSISDMATQPFKENL